MSPKYNYDDTVSFKIIDEDNVEHILTGKVYIIDRYGTFFDNSDVSYDVMVESGDYPTEYPCLFKHINEKLII